MVKDKLIVCTEFDKDFEVWKKLKTAPAWIYGHLRKLPFGKFVDENTLAKELPRVHVDYAETLNGLRLVDRHRLLDSLVNYFRSKDRR